MQNIPAGSARVLVVDDDASFAADLVHRLAMASITGEVAGSAREARVSLAGRLPHVLILDRRLGDGDGLELCRAIKSAERTWDLPVLGVSGDSEIPIGDTIKAGFDHWFVKPVDIGQLVERIRVIAHASASHRATAEKAQRLTRWREWVSVLVHELRSPLDAAIGAVNRASRVMDQDLRLRLDLEDARGDLGMVAEMLEDIVDVDRLQRASLSPRFESFALDQLAAKVGEGLGGLDLSVATHDGQGPCWVAGDPRLLERVLRNLMGGALKHRRSADVRVEILTEETEVVVSVTNDGPGIDEELRDRLFDPWMQAAGSAQSSPARYPTGLGLAFCRLVVEAHGGRLWLASGADGGVDFRFALPR